MDTPIVHGPIKASARVGLTPSETGAGVNFVDPKFADAYILDLEPIADERGFFSRTFCQQEFMARAERGVRHDDPALGIDWPLPVTVISEKDAHSPLLQSTETRASPR